MVYGTIQIMWLDALIILPLLCVAIINCIENDKRIWLIILYSYLIISQFYMAYMVCFFSLLFVVFYLLLIYETKSEHKTKERLYKFFNWGIAVMISIMISAVIWVPTLFFLMANRVPDSTEIRELNVTLLQIINSLFWGAGYGIEGTYAYLYCGIPVIILVPAFFIDKHIKNK